MLIHLDEEKTVTVHPVDLLLPIDVGPSQNVAAPSVPLGARKAHGQGRKARARRPGMLAAAARSIGEKYSGFLKERRRLILGEQCWAVGLNVDESIGLQTNFRQLLIAG